MNKEVTISKHPENILRNLLALLEGLEVPNPCLWASQEDPETLRLLGAAICNQAKLVKESGIKEVSTVECGCGITPTKSLG